MNEEQRRKGSVRYGEEGEVGEDQQGCGLAAGEVSLWQGGQKRGRGYHVSCTEEGVGLLCHLPLMTEREQEELRRDIKTSDQYFRSML